MPLIQCMDHEMVPVDVLSKQCPALRGDKTLSRAIGTSRGMVMDDIERLGNALSILKNAPDLSEQRTAFELILDICKVQDRKPETVTKFIAEDLLEDTTMQPLFLPFVKRLLAKGKEEESTEILFSHNLLNLALKSRGLAVEVDEAQRERDVEAEKVEREKMKVEKQKSKTKKLLLIFAATAFTTLTSFSLNLLQAVLSYGNDNECSCS